MEGIDVAGVDLPTVDWAEVARSGRAFAFARGCYKMTPDRGFAQYWPAIKNAGLVRGAYLFWDPRLDPLQVTARFLDTVGPLGPGDFPPTIDVEFPNGLAATGVAAGQAIRNLQATVQAFETRLRVSPIIYTSRRVWSGDLGNPQNTGLGRCPLWVPRYSPLDPQCPDEWGPGNWWIHQYAGDVTNAPGVQGKTDLDRFNLLKEGDSGPRVVFVQNKLILPPNGTFDESVLEAVQAFQRANGLRVDGVVGPLTWSYLVWESANPLAA